MAKNTCDVDLIHLEDVNYCKEEIQELPLDNLLQQLKLVADEKRFKILYSLSLKEELCVCDIANILDSSIATTSHHLQQLKKIGAVDSRKQGKLLYYHLINKDLLSIIQFVLSMKKEVA